MTQETTPPMQPHEFARRMREIAQSAEDDPEVGHLKADNLMIELLRSLGYGEGVNIFDEMPRWYA